MAVLTCRSSELLLRLPGSLSACLLNAQQPPQYSTDVGRLNLAAAKRGRGGRSSFSGEVVTVFGSNGFLGRGVVNRLGKNGSQMILPYRGDHYKMMRLKVAGDLGQVLFCPFELGDEDSIRRAVARSSIVINLVGRQWETKNFKYEDVNIEGPATLARISKEMGVKKFVHISSINAKETPDKCFLPGGSRFLRTKFLGEQAVRAEFPEAIIFRPADVYGPGDAYLNYYLSKFRQNGNKGVPLFAKGELTVKQPLHLSDMTSGIMASLHNPEAEGTTYEALGPQRHTLASIIDYMYGAANRDMDEYGYKRTELMLDPLSFAKTIALDTLKLGQTNTYYGHTLDKLERHSLSDQSEGLPNLTDLGVTPMPMTDRVRHDAKAWDYFAYYEFEVGEEIPPVIPPALSAMEERELDAVRDSWGPLAFVPKLVPALV